MDTTTGPQSVRYSRRRLLLAATAGSSLGFAGCIGDLTQGDDNPSDIADEFVFAATVQDDPDEVAQDYRPLADWIERQTDIPTRVDALQGDSAAISALATGQAHAAYLSGGPAWVGWQTYELEPLAVEVDDEGNTFYTAAAWVRAESDIQTVADLEGIHSCHTGDMTGAGMLIPMAHLAHEGLVTFEDSDDITAIRDAVDEFFGDPLIGGGYVGALQCLSQGHGDVAFIRKSTPEDYCSGDDPESWCLEMDEYQLLEEFAKVPSHPMMASPETTEAEFELLQDALLALNEDSEGREILNTVLNTPALTTTTSEDHLGAYGELIEILPGIEDHLVE